MSVCALPDAPVVTDVPHTQLGDFGRQRSLVASLDLDYCNVAYITMPLDAAQLEQMRKGTVGHRAETWPTEIRDRMDRELVRWLGDDGAKAVKAITQGVNDGCCVLAIHWKPRAVEVAQ